MSDRATGRRVEVTLPLLRGPAVEGLHTGWGGWDLGGGAMGSAAGLTGVSWLCGACLAMLQAETGRAVPNGEVVPSPAGCVGRPLALATLVLVDGRVGDLVPELGGLYVGPGPKDCKAMPRQTIPLAVCSTAHWPR